MSSPFAIPELEAEVVGFAEVAKKSYKRSGYSPEFLKEAARVAVRSLYKPLVAFATLKMTNEIRKRERIGIKGDEMVKPHSYFMLTGDSRLPLTFNLNSMLEESEGGSVSFAELCFGPQKEGGTFSQRDSDQAWFNQLGLGWEASPICLLDHAMRSYFGDQKRTPRCFTKLTVAVLRPKMATGEAKYEEGMSCLEIFWNGNPDFRFREQECSWTDMIPKLDTDKMTRMFADIMTEAKSEASELFQGWISLKAQETHALDFADETQKMIKEVMELKEMIAQHKALPIRVTDRRHKKTSK